MEKKELYPFTKWVGGKRQLLPEIKKLLPENFNNYFEPFIGGGAVLFNLQPKNAVINDLNDDLVLTYKAIRDDVENLILLLEKHAINNSSEYFYKIRDLDRTDTINKLSNTERAARLLYMLRVNFNGLYRVNKKGQFNVPYGKYKNPKIVDPENLKNISQYLNNNNIKILNGDFEKALENVKKGDFVYLDPPYEPISKTASFTSYTKEGFGIDAQERIFKIFKDLDEKGVYVMISNSDASLIRDLFKDYSETTYEVLAKRNVNSDANKRGAIKELIITNYVK